NKIIKNIDNSVTDTLQKLIQLKIIEKRDELSSTLLFDNQNPMKFSNKPWLSAPETIHWAVTYRCTENCPDCYVRRFSVAKNELPTHKALELIDKIADWNVFQLAIGGGEPLTRKDLPQLVQYAANRGLSVHVTTGMLRIDPHLLKSISHAINNLQIGVQPDRLLGSHSTKTIHQLEELFSNVQTLGLTPGANLFLTESVIKQLEDIIKILVANGFNRIILLRYKPPENIERWKKKNPGKFQIKTLHENIKNIIKQNPQLNIRVDCALSFVQRYLPQKLATQLGIKGCVAADRILAVAPDGSVYPCSQLVHPEFHAGNLLETEPKILWDESPILRKYRSFRTKKSFTHSWCGVCLAKPSCGGCRVFAADGLGGDPGCPEPVLPPLTRLEKIGRNLDLAEYLKRHQTISVGEYMERYGVSQKSAIKELNKSPNTISTNGKSARKKKDAYEYLKEDNVLNIQHSIGYTSNGFPYATYEQISEWIEDPCYLNNYPDWSRRKSKISSDELLNTSKKEKGVP
ncbi:MAG: SPASM domain-containing protein, partial [bacterium]